MANRRHAIIDQLEPQIQETVKEMLRANFTYKDIVDYLASNGTQVSQSAVCRYAARFAETTEALRMAQENFRGIMEETAKYPNLDPTDGILRLISHQLLDAINGMPEEQRQAKNFDELIKSAVALTRAVAYKKQVDIKSKDLLENGADSFPVSCLTPWQRSDRTCISSCGRLSKKRRRSHHDVCAADQARPG